MSPAACSVPVSSTYLQMAAHVGSNKGDMGSQNLCTVPCFVPWVPLSQAASKKGPFLWQDFVARLRKRVEAAAVWARRRAEAGKQVLKLAWQGQLKGLEVE